MFLKISEKYVEKSRQTYFLDDHFSAIRHEKVFVSPNDPRNADLAKKFKKFYFTTFVAQILKPKYSKFKKFILKSPFFAWVFTAPKV